MPASKRTKRGREQWEADPYQYLAEVAGNEQQLLQIVQNKLTQKNLNNFIDQQPAQPNPEAHQKYSQPSEFTNLTNIQDEMQIKVSNEILQKASKEDILKIVSDEVQRHLLPYPNWTQDHILKPWMPHSFMDLNHLHKQEPVAFLAVKVLGAELFRKGITIKRKFWGKCDKCGQKYDTKPPHLYSLSERDFNKKGSPCDECDKGTLWPPDKDERTFLEEYIKNVNLNNQSLTQVCREAEKDINVYDNLYIGLIKEYEYGKDKKLYSKIREIVRLDPIVMRISTDERGIIGNDVATCLFHRSEKILLRIKKPDGTEEPNKDLQCPICGDKRLYPVEFIASREGIIGMEEIMYIPGEVLHANRYYPSSLYGFSPLLVAWDAAVSLIDMTKYIKDSFRNRQIPRGMMFMPGTPESVKASREQAVIETKKNPHNIPWFSIPTSGDIKATPQFISFMNTLQELEYTAVRDEFRLRITSLYGVSPFMQNDISQGGGLNSEGMQLTITNRAAEHNQTTWNTVKDSPGLFEKILDALGIFDWKLHLEPPEEKDLAAPLDRKYKKIQNAEGMQRLGYEAQLPEDGLTDENDFVFVKREVDPSNPFGFSPGNMNFPNSGSQRLPQGNLPAGAKPVSGGTRNNPTSQSNRGKPTQTSQQAAVHTQEERMDGEPTKPSYQATKGLSLQDFINKIDPVDKLAYELYNTVANYYKQIILVTIGSRFKEVPPEHLTRVEIMGAIMEMLKLTNEHIIEFGKNFAMAAFHLGAFLAETVGNQTEDSLPNITISALLQIGGREDKDALLAYEQAQPFREAFQNFGLGISNELRAIVERSFREEKFTIDQLVSQMQNVVTTETWRLERIARSEVTRFSNEGRILAYKRQEADQEKQFKYIWLVTHDDRTSQECKEIARLVPPDGVSIDELYNILVDVQTRLMGPKWIPSWLVHPHCRSRPMRRVQL